MKYPTLCGLLLFALCSAGCWDQERNRSSSTASRESRGQSVVLTEVTEAAGVDFVHCHGGTGRHYYVETMTGGCAFLDYDSDGWLDLFLVQGAPLPGYQPALALSDALYRNNRDGTFTDVALEAGVADNRYGLGCCTGDVDNDGDTDLFVTNLDGNVLYRNKGDGTFSDVTERAGIAGKSLCTSAAFLDYDRDGWLDLFICRYMDYDLEENPRCKDRLGRPSYCSPHVYEGTHSLLYRNNGDGTFADVSNASSISRFRGRGMGVACADYNGDGWVDIYVANDLTPNHMFLNGRDGTFREAGALMGVSYGDRGVSQAGMGVDCGDYNNDGHVDLFVTNFENEPNALYENNGNGMYFEEAEHLRSDDRSPQVRAGGEQIALAALAGLVCAA